jgi:pimeloyl-ACP methyl ester carboxylesterase
MLRAETLPAEGSRYASGLLCIPGLWAETRVWRGFASYLGHRGWECHLLDVRGVPGGLAARAAAVGEYAAGLAAPPVLVGHDAGGLVALAAAARGPTAAVVLLAPVAPGSRAARRLVLAPRSLAALLLGRVVSPPTGPGAGAWASLPPELRSCLAAEDAASVREVVWGRIRPAPAAHVPTLVVAGTADPLLEASAADALARSIGGELARLEGADHWLIAGPHWQSAVALVHRWLVRRLGEPLLETYAETMAEREPGDGE